MLHTDAYVIHCIFEFTEKYWRKIQRSIDRHSKQYAQMKIQSSDIVQSEVQLNELFYLSFNKYSCLHKVKVQGRTWFGFISVFACLFFSFSDLMLLLVV